MNEESFVIRVSGLSKTYKRREGEIHALRDFNLEISGGEIFGLLGPNGAGKTTAVKMIMGFVRPTGGEIRFKGKKLEVAQPRPQIGYMPESFRPNPNLTVFEYVKFHYSLAGGEKDGNADGHVRDILRQVGMDRFQSRRISDLSKGMGQRVGLAQAFANDPDFLILDEPTSGLDPVGRSEVIGFLVSKKTEGKTIFFCSHILSEVERLCDRIGILVNGNLRYVGDTGAFKEKCGVSDLEDAFKKEAACEAPS